MLADNDIDFQSTAVLIWQRLRHERCIQAVLGCNRFHNGFIMHHVVCCGQRIATCEINFILSWPMLVTGGSRIQSHFFQRQADFPSGIFALVQRCNVQIAALVIGFSGRIALYISLKQIKFTAGCNLTLIVVFFNLSHGIAEILPQVPCIRLAVHGHQIAEEPDNSAGLRSPRQNGKGRAFRFQQ